MSLNRTPQALGIAKIVLREQDLTDHDILVRKCLLIKIDQS